MKRWTTCIGAGGCPCQLDEILHPNREVERAIVPDLFAHDWAGALPPPNPAGKNRFYPDADRGAVGSDSIVPLSVQLSSFATLNERSVITVIPAGSNEPPAGGAAEGAVASGRHCHRHAASLPSLVA